MKNLFKFLNEKWYRFPILSIIVGVICLFLILNAGIPTSLYFYVFCFVLPIIVLFFSGISSLLKFFKKDYKNGILQIISTTIIFGIGCAIAILMGMFSFIDSNDFYADRLEIPKNIKIEKPIDLDYFENNKRPKNILTKTVAKTDFQIYNINQPGIYTYDIWANKTENGFYYLKAIEITKNDILSEESIFRRSKIINSPQIINFKRKELNGDFTVYEGDWGKPYAARFELWFHNDSLKTDEKLISKNYIIEGWMR